MSDTSQDIEPVPPCRVLVRNGIALAEPEIITERPRVVEDFKRTDIQPAPQSLYVPHGATIHGRVSHSLRAGRPRTRPPKAHPPAGRGKAWNRNEAVTDEQILAMRQQGWSYQKIGDALGIDPSTACYRLNRRERKAASAQREQATN